MISEIFGKGLRLLIVLAVLMGAFLAFTHPLAVLILVAVAIFVQLLVEIVV